MRVDAGRCARTYHLVDGRPRTAAIAVDGRDIPVDGPEITITVRGRLEHVELDRWAGLAVEGPAATGEPVPYNAGPVGLGQPLFGPGFFAGVEHPVAENLAGPEGASCALPLAVDLGPQPYRTPATVVGAGGLDDFWDYVDTLRPVPPRLVTLANNWVPPRRTAHHGRGVGTGGGRRLRRRGRAPRPRARLRRPRRRLGGRVGTETGLWGRIAPRASKRNVSV